MAAPSFVDQYNQMGDTGQITAFQPPAAPKQNSGLVGQLVKSLVNPFVQTGKTIAHAPAMVMADVQGFKGGQAGRQAAQKQQQIQQQTFGTTDQGAIAKNIVGNLGSIAADVAVPEAKAGMAAKVLQGAKVGAAGGAAGSLAENGNADDVINGAVHGGMFGGLVGGGAGALGKAGSGVSKLANKAETKAANKEAYTNIQPFENVASGQDVQGAAELMRQHNMPTTPEAMKTAASLTTGKTGEFNSALRQILGGNGGTPIQVPVGNYLQVAKEAINAEPMLGMAEAKTGSGSKLMSAITKNKENGLFDGQGSLGQAADANKVLDAIQYHQGQAARLKGAIPGSEGEAIANVHKQAADYLNQQLGEHAGANQAVAKYQLSPDDAQAIKDNVEQQSGSPQLGQHIVDTINKAQSVGDLRSAQAPFVRASQLADEAAQYGKGKGYVSDLKTAANPKQGPANGVSPYIAMSATHGNPVGVAELIRQVVRGGSGLIEKGASAANNAVKHVAGSANNANLPTRAESLVGQDAGRTQADNTQDANATEESPLTPEEHALNDAINHSVAKNQTGDDTGGDNANDPFNSDNIKMLVAADLAKNDGKNVSTLLSLYNTFGKAKETQSTQEKNTADNLTGALSVLKTYNDQLNSAGGGRGPVGGRIENLLGKVGAGGNTATQVRAIESQKTDVATAIAKALTNGKPSAQQIKSWEDAIPTASDSPAVAKQKITNITASIQSRLDTLQNGGSIQ